MEAQKHDVSDHVLNKLYAACREEGSNGGEGAEDRAAGRVAHHPHLLAGLLATPLADRRAHDPLCCSYMCNMRFRNRISAACAAPARGTLATPGDSKRWINGPT